MKLREIKEIFAKNANPTDKIPMESYMRNQFEFYGIRAGKRRDISRAFIKEAKLSDKIDWDFLETLFRDSAREINYLGLDILKAQTKLLTLSDFDKLVHLAEIRPRWDTIDNIDTIIGTLGLVENDFDKKILDLSKDYNFWLRRIAIGHQKKYKEKTKTDLLAKIIKNNLQISCEDTDEKFFIDKAIGWALREYSKTNPAWVRDFIGENKNDLAPLSIREASKYL